METRVDPRETYRAWASDSLARWIPRDAPHFERTASWVKERYDEGYLLGADLVKRLRNGTRPPPWRILDLGAGNGGVSLGISQDEALRVVACDVFRNPEVPELFGAVGRRFRYAVGRAERLPFTDGCFDAIVLLDVLEHLPDPRTSGAEVARLLAPGGIVVVTTPPRTRFLLRGDPHYGVWGLALLPAPLQRLVAEKVVRRTTRYDVRHLYVTPGGIAREFPGLELAEVTGTRRLCRLGVDWDRIVLRKPAP